MIVKSSYTKEHPQKDGRVWVCERHVHDDGEVIEYRYLCDPKDDPATVKELRAADLVKVSNEKALDAAR